MPARQPAPDLPTPTDAAADIEAGTGTETGTEAEDGTDVEAENVPLNRAERRAKKKADDDAVNAGRPDVAFARRGQARSAQGRRVNPIRRTG